jgi:hypothetical protein
MLPQVGVSKFGANKILAESYIPLTSIFLNLSDFNLLRCSVSCVILLHKMSLDERCGDPHPGTLLCFVMGHLHATIWFVLNGLV